MPLNISAIVVWKDSFINLESFRTFRGSLFNKPTSSFGSTVFLSASRVFFPFKRRPCKRKHWYLCSVRLKPRSTFGIVIGADSFSEIEPFFIYYFSNFLIFFCFLGGYKSLKAWNRTQIFKNDLENLEYLVPNLVWGALLWLKRYPILLVTRFSLWNLVSVTVSAESIGQFGFQFRH